MSIQKLGKYYPATKYTKGGETIVMKTAVDQVDTSSLANVFFGKSFSTMSSATSGNSSFGELLSGLVNSKSAASFSNTRKPAVSERSSSLNRKPEVSRRDAAETAGFVRRNDDKIDDRSKIDNRSDKTKMSSKDNVREAQDRNEKNSGAEASSKEEVIEQSHRIIKKLNSNDDSSIESELSALRADETVGEFWQSLDDQSAMELIESLEAITPEMLAASLSLMKNMSAKVQQISPEVEEQPELIEAVEAISDEEETEMPEGDEDSSDEEEVEVVSAQALSVSAELQVQEAPKLSESEATPVETEAVTLDSKAQDVAITKTAEKVTKPVVSEKKSETTVSEKKSEAPVSNSPTEDVLAALRSNPETSEFWKSVDDETAHKLLSVLSKMKDPKAEEALAAPVSGEETADAGSELPAAASAESSSQALETSMEANPAEKRPTKKSHEQAQGGEDSTVASEDASQPATTLKSSTFGGAVKSLRQEFREAMGMDSHSAPSSSSGSAGTPVTSASTFSVTTSAQAAVISEAPDLSDLLKSFSSRGETAKADGAQTLGAASNQAVKRVSMSGQETSRDFSFTRDQSSTMASMRSESSQAKGGDPVKSAVFSKIMENAEFFKGPQQVKVMTLELKPESLGKLEMQIATKDGAVTARISAENSIVKEKLEQLVPQIREHLSQQGVNILQISVDISRQNSDGNNKSFSDGEYQHGLRIGSRKAARGSSSDTDRSASSVLVNPEIRRMALNIKAVDVTV